MHEAPPPPSLLLPLPVSLLYMPTCVSCMRPTCARARGARGGAAAGARARLSSPGRDETRPVSTGVRDETCPVSTGRRGGGGARGRAPDVRGTLDADLIAVVALDGVAHKAPERARQQVHAHPVACAPRRA